MKVSISTAFLLVFSQAVSIASARPSPDNGTQQCNNNSLATKTVTLTAQNAVTKTVTVDAGVSTGSAASNGTVNNNNNGRNNSGKNNNGGINNVGNNSGGQSNSGSTNSTTGAGTSNSTDTGGNNGTNNNGTSNGGQGNSGSTNSTSGTGTGNSTDTSSNNGKNNSGTSNGGNSNSGSKGATTSTATNNSSGTSNNNGKISRGTSNVGNNGGNDPQSSLQLDPQVIGANIAQNGVGKGSTAGEVASQTSKNNFINACLGKTITNGQQITAGSCNPIPMGDLPSRDKMPKCKIFSPKNLDTIPENTSFDISMTLENLEAGNFVNPETNYFAAPQALSSGGTIVGHSHFVVQQINGLQDTAPLDPTIFAFFQGANKATVDKKLTVTVSKGLPKGTYRVSSINTAANHQPANGPVAQHGSFDDAVYFTVSNTGAPAAGAISNVAGAGTANQASNTSSAAKATATNTNGTANAKTGTTKGGRRMARRFAPARLA